MAPRRRAAAADPAPPADTPADEADAEPQPSSRGRKPARTSAAAAKAVKGPAAKKRRIVASSSDGDEPAAEPEKPTPTRAARGGKASGSASRPASAVKRGKGAAAAVEAEPADDGASHPTPSSKGKGKAAVSNEATESAAGRSVPEAGASEAAPTAAESAPESGSQPQSKRKAPMSAHLSTPGQADQATAETPAAADTPTEPPRKNPRPSAIDAVKASEPTVPSSQSSPGPSKPTPGGSTPSTAGGKPGTPASSKPTGQKRPGSGAVAKPAQGTPVPSGGPKVGGMDWAKMFTSSALPSVKKKTVDKDKPSAMPEPTKIVEATVPTAESGTPQGGTPLSTSTPNDGSHGKSPNPVVKPERPRPTNAELDDMRRDLRRKLDKMEPSTFDPFHQQLQTAEFERRFHEHTKALKAEHPNLPRDLTFGSVFYLFATDKSIDAAPASALARTAEPTPASAPAKPETKHRRKSSAGSQPPPPLQSPRMENVGASPGLLLARTEPTPSVPAASSFELK